MDESQDPIPKPSPWPMRVGAIGTVVWAALTLVYLWLKWLNPVDLKPNEFGDFLAGIFAPLAFLWIVVGYLQQSNELRLQVAELSSQVKASNRLAKSAVDRGRRDEAEIQPVFDLKDRHVSKDNTTTLRLINKGGIAINVTIGGKKDNIMVVAMAPRTVSQGQDLPLAFPNSHDGWFELLYTDQHTQKRNIWCYWDGKVVIKHRLPGDDPILDTEELKRWLDPSNV